MEHLNENHSEEDQRTQRFVQRLCIELEYGKAQYININRTRFSDEQAEELSKVLVKNTSVKKISIRGSDLLTPEGVAVLGDAIVKTNRIMHFEIADVQMNDEAMQSMGKILQLCPSLMSFGISKIRGKKVTQRGWNALISSLSNNSTLRVLDLSDNNIDDDIAVSFASGVLQQMPKNHHHINKSRLQCLVLSMNGIHDKGAKGIANALLCNTTLKMLGLADNKLTAESLNAFVQTLNVNCSLQRCYLFGNRFRHDCYEKSHISYLLDLNLAGRGLFRDEAGSSTNAAILPYLLERRSQNPNIVYGLLSELPHVWAPSENR